MLKIKIDDKTAANHYILIRNVFTYEHCWLSTWGLLESCGFLLFSGFSTSVHLSTLFECWMLMHTVKQSTSGREWVSVQRGRECGGVTTTDSLIDSTRLLAARSPQPANRVCRDTRKSKCARAERKISIFPIYGASFCSVNPVQFIYSMAFAL